MNLEQRRWERGTIRYRALKGTGDYERLSVRFLPGSRGKLAIDEGTGYFCFHDTTRGRWVRVEHGVIAFYRMLTNICVNHDHELPRLEEVAALCRGVNVELILLDKDGGNGNPIRHDLTRATTLVGRVVDPDKVRAKRHIELSLPLRDSKGRVNIGVLRCRSTTAFDNIMSRMNRVRGMRPWIWYYRQMIRELIETLDGLVRSAERTLARAYQKVLSLSEINERTKRYLDEQLRVAEGYLRLADVKPYTRVRAHTLRETAEMRQALAANDRAAFVRLAEVSLMSLRLLLCRTPIELAKMHVSVAVEHPHLLGARLKGIIVRRLVGIIDRDLAAIDDRGFRQKVIADVRAHLRTAVDELRKRAPNLALAKTELDLAVKPM